LQNILSEAAYPECASALPGGKLRKVAMILSLLLWHVFQIPLLWPLGEKFFLGVNPNY